ncbi:condensation domain-containing protein [Streptomyces sp. M19]
MLLAALLLAWRRRFGRTALQLDIEGHGREPIGDGADVSRTVGWFTSIHPVVFDTAEADGAPRVLEHVRSRTAEVPSHGIGYGLLRYLTDAGAELAALAPSRLSFNYLGRFDQPAGERRVFGVPSEIPTVVQSQAATRPYLIEVVAVIVAGVLTLEWTYGAASHDRATVRALLDAQAAAVPELVADLLARPAADAAPFPLARIGADQIDAIQRRLAPGRRDDGRRGRRGPYRPRTRPCTGW